MYHYNFTNDLRISNLDDILFEAANAYLTDSVPSASEDKSKNNNYNTVGFYFNLKAKGNCAKLASKKQIKKVVLNFIKKFQYPNPRTPTDYENARNDGILLSPMRDIVKLLHIFTLINTEEAYLTKEEIINFIFYNNDIAKRQNYNLLATATQIIQYRQNNKLPANIDIDGSTHEWNQPERQIREMIRTLNYSGCILEDADKIKLVSTSLSRDVKADLFEIINCSTYWTGEGIGDYQKYMDDIDFSDEGITVNENQTNIYSSATPHTSPMQKIFYGVPGCGKSHKISEILNDKNIFKIQSEETQILRTVFHPDYTNADFVGQILPEVNGSKIEYNFKAGPFTEILAKALVHPKNQYVLIIEEINRGNSAAIFGEIFQLLDRLEEGTTSSVDGVNKYGKGWSEYFFENELINEYVRKKASPSDEIESSVQINGIAFSVNTGIRLPPNLSLLATMNTSDQNVFTLDNAFQRRWDMEYISNKYDESKATEKQKDQYESIIGETQISWGKFRDAINKEISNPENSFANAEDKQFGLFFIKAENGVIKESDFSNKVLKYLWNDIFKRDKSIFNDDVSTFGELLEVFNGADAFVNSFNSDFVSKLQNKVNG